MNTHGRLSTSTRLIPLVILLLVAAGAAPRATRTPNADMAEAARRFLDVLSPEQRSHAAFALDNPARLDWHYIPRSRPGVTLGEMTDAQRAAARALMRSALSSRGVLKAEAIMQLDAVLRELEKDSGPTRDPLAYAFSVFGTPGEEKPWGWKLEGHHISLNFTSPSAEVTDVTPAFLGANPAEVPSGPRAGERVLAAEEDLGRELLRSLDEAQQAEAVLKMDAPADIITSPGRDLDSAPPEGLAVSKMTPAQRVIVERLLAEFAGNLRAELAEHELEHIRQAGWENVRFAWAGGAEKGQPHYYRLAGPTFVIEYDNTQNSANHIHTVWHDRGRDFGSDVLHDHYLEPEHRK